MWVIGIEVAGYYFNKISVKTSCLRRRTYFYYLFFFNLYTGPKNPTGTVTFLCQVIDIILKWISKNE